MTDAKWTEVDAYFEAKLLREDPALDYCLRTSRKAGLPDIQVSPVQGRLLELIAAASGARRILEIGTLGGYSAICLARALPEGGRLVTLEVEPKHAEVARGNLERAGLVSKVEIRLGPALETLPKLAAEGTGPFDLVFLDADRPNNRAYIEWALRLTHPGSLIVVDNVVRRGEVVDAKTHDPSVAGVRAMIEAVAAEGRLRATGLQTVGKKGYDGFLLARVESPEAVRSRPANDR